MVVGLLSTAAFIYLVATALFLARLLRGAARRAPAAELSMALATFTLLGATVTGFNPTSPTGAASLAVLFMGCAASGIALVMLRWGDFPLLGPVTSAFAGMLALALALHALFPSPPPIGPLSPVTILHITATFVGYLLFVPAFVLANLYLGQSWRLRTRQPTSQRLPPLVTLETHTWRLLGLGFILFSLGIIGGWLSSEGDHQTLRPQHAVGALAWLIYAVALTRRYAFGWRGGRAAIALITGFVVTSGAILLYVLR